MVSGPKLIKLPTNEEKTTYLVDTYHKNYGFPQCLSAIGSTHITINTAQKMKFSINDFFRILSHLLKKSLMENSLCSEKNKQLTL